MGLNLAEIVWQTKIDQKALDDLGKIEWGALWPAWVVVGGILIVLLADLILPKSQRRVLSLLSLVVLLAGLASAFVLMDNRKTAFQGMVAADDLSRFMAVVIFGAAALIILASPDYLSRIGIEVRSEYYALVLATAAGMWLITVSLNFMVFFVSLELFSLALYILAGFLPRSLRSHEAGFKYFLLSSFATAFMLYGIALIFGATGTTGYSGITAYLAKSGISGDKGILILFGLAMIAVGFAFKVSAVPFHLWTADVYEGSPTPVTALMAVGTKAAIIGAFLRVFNGAFEPIREQWQPIIWALAALTMVGGNLLAVSQSNIKRLLAYSAVAQAGYLLIGVATDNTLARQGLLFYLLSYTIMTIGAFAVLMALEGPRGEGQLLSDFAGLGRTHPWLAATMTVCLLSLAGIPPTAGFFGKALVFGGAIQAGGWFLALALIGIVTSIIAAFYYFRIIVQMYMTAPRQAVVAASNETPARPAIALSGRPAWAVVLVLLVAAVGTLLLGILAGYAVDWAQTAAALR